MTEVYAIDPDVFVAASLNDQCKVALSQVSYWFEDGRIRLAVDGDSVESEYIELLSYSGIASQMGPKLLNELFRCREIPDRVIHINPGLDEQSRQFVIDKGCDTPVEPNLIGMATRQSLNLLLIGRDEIRKRGLHQKGVPVITRRFIRSKYRRSFKVVNASDVGIKNEEVQHELHSRCFEGDVRSLLLKRIEKETGNTPSHWHPEPSEVFHYVTNYEKKCGQVDIYIYEQSGNPRNVWIGECYLTQEGNEYSLVDLNKVQELDRKCQAALFFESKYDKNPVFIHGYLITNSMGLSPEAQSFISEKNQKTGNLHYRYVKVEMKNEWTINPKWMLVDKDLEEFDLFE